MGLKNGSNFHSSADSNNPELVIILQDCNYKKSMIAYYKKKFKGKISCFCGEEPDKEKLIEYFLTSPGMQTLAIENPSRLIGILDTAYLQNIQNLIFSGNDSDNLDSIPDILLSLKNLKKISMYNIYFPKGVIEGYRKKYPAIKFEEI